MRHAWLISGITACAAALTAAANAATPVVIGADGILCNLTKTLAAEQAEVGCIVGPGKDPHNLRLRPSERKQLANADLVLINGYSLTPALDRVTTKQPVVRVGEIAIPNHPGNDPHLWHDPQQVIAMSGVVSNKLKAINAIGSANAISNRQQQAVSVLKDLDGWIKAQIATVPPQQRVLVTSHRSFAPMARRYGIKELPLLDKYATGGTLRPSSLSQISSAIKASGTKAIFADKLPASKTMRRISRSSGIPIASKPLYSEGTAPGRSLVQTATDNVCNFVVSQGGQCNTQQADQLAERWKAIS
jgi:zinc/manganese transport system substrate-binding protein